MSEQNAIVQAHPYSEDFIGQLTETESTSFCSFNPATPEERGRLYNAMSNPDHRLGDHINETIKIKDVFCEIVPCTSATGEVSQCPRIVIFDENGTTYQSVSMGIFSSIKRIFSLFGIPSEWKEPIPVEVKQISKGEKKILNLKVVI